ncbi:MAG: hypothetical protein HQL84_01565 [Magnetococcales bacterium]|nr:hypothetical protein [Magnetococcales bacterium]MBF0148714.1 hypothetical protein [Magnetococcales bacterium]MBF0630263.1 hypothetical protein [Magnetococcales bacterium]
MNCWDHFSCPRSRFSQKPDGSHCPVSLIGVYHGVNGGVNAGRACWNIEGTFCSISACGNPPDQRGIIGFKENHCDRCEFKARVRAEEGNTFQEDRTVRLPE